MEISGRSAESWPLKRVVLLLALLFAFYGYLWGNAPNYNLPNEFLQTEQARGIWHRQELWINHEGPAYDYPDTVVFKGKMYPNKSPGGALWLAWTVPIADRLCGAKLTPKYFFVTRLLGLTLPFVLFLYYFGRKLEKIVSPAAAWGLVAAYALGSNAGIYATIYFAHNLAAICLASAFFLLWREKPRPFAAGLWAGAGVITENSSFVAPVILGILAWRSGGKRSAAAFAAGLIPAFLIQAIYQMICFGSPWITPESLYHDQEFGSFIMGLPSLKAVYGLLLGPSRGLFFHSPWMLWALGAAIYAKTRDRREQAFAWTLLAFPAAQVLWLSAYELWDGGWAIGPRYLTSSFPFLVIACALGWKTVPESRKQMARIALFALAAASALHYLFFFASVPYHPNLTMPASFNYLRAVAWPFLHQGFSVYTTANFFGASVTASQLLLAGIWASALSCVVWAFPRRWRSVVVLRGLLWGAVLFGVICSLGESGGELGEQAIRITLGRNHYRGDR